MARTRSSAGRLLPRRPSEAVGRKSSLPVHWPNLLPLQPNCVLAAPTEGVLLPHLALVPLSIPKAPSLLGLGLGQEWRAGKGAPSPHPPGKIEPGLVLQGALGARVSRGWERLGRVHYHCYRQVPELLMSLKLEAAGRS